jgi:hypothetical protein
VNCRRGGTLVDREPFIDRPITARCVGRELDDRFSLDEGIINSNLKRIELHVYHGNDFIYLNVPSTHSHFYLDDGFIITTTT